MQEARLNTMPGKQTSQPRGTPNIAGRPAKDPEIHAMGMCVKVLEPLDGDARARVLQHILDRYQIAIAEH